MQPWSIKAPTSLPAADLLNLDALRPHTTAAFTHESLIYLSDDRVCFGLVPPSRSGETHKSIRMHIKVNMVLSRQANPLSEGGRETAGEIRERMLDPIAAINYCL